MVSRFKILDIIADGSSQVDDILGAHFYAADDVQQPEAPNLVRHVSHYSSLGSSLRLYSEIGQYLPVSMWKLYSVINVDCKCVLNNTLQYLCVIIPSNFPLLHSK